MRRSIRFIGTLSIVSLLLLTSVGFRLERFKQWRSSLMLQPWGALSHTRHTQTYQQNRRILRRSSASAHGPVFPLGAHGMGRLCQGLRVGLFIPDSTFLRYTMFHVDSVSGPQ